MSFAMVNIYCLSFFGLFIQDEGMHTNKMPKSEYKAYECNQKTSNQNIPLFLSLLLTCYIYISFFLSFLLPLFISQSDSHHKQ